MKNKSLKLIICSLLLMIISCNEPETIVTNYIHRDGSFTRVIEMRSIENKFELSDLQVPFDSTWSIMDTVELLSIEPDDKDQEDTIRVKRADDKDQEDTIWVKRAQKKFIGIDEINAIYGQDSGANKGIHRSVAFEKKFKWFNTEFKFSENIGKQLDFGYPITDFLNEQELMFFYSPKELQDDQLNGPDSLKYRSLEELVNLKTDRWLIHSIFPEWTNQFAVLLEDRGADDMIDDLRANENKFISLMEEKYSEEFDSLWGQGIILEEFIGKANAEKYMTEADSAINIALNKFFITFSDYTVSIVMPGKLTSTNGYMDSSKVLLWPVKSDYFLTQPYEMWAESKVTNVWAWVVSGLFILFVLTGIVLKTLKKAE